MTALSKRGHRLMLLALFTLLPCTSAGDIQHGKWTAGRVVRVAAAPTLHPAPEDAADPEVLQTLAHGFAALVARHSGLTFVEVPFSSTLAAMAAVCEGRADLVLAMGADDGARLPCPSLAPSRSFPGGASVLAGRIGERLPRRVADLGTLRIAAVEGGPYPVWLAQHPPAVPVLPHPSMRAALAAVDAGIADAAIGLESTAGAMARRHFSHSLRLQTVDAIFRPSCICLPGAKTRRCWIVSRRHWMTSPSKSMPSCCSAGHGRRCRPRSARRCAKALMAPCSGCCQPQPCCWHSRCWLHAGCASSSVLIRSRRR